MKSRDEIHDCLKHLISETSIYLVLTGVGNSMSLEYEDRTTVPDSNRTVFDKLSIRWGLVFVDATCLSTIPVNLRRRMLKIFHFSHSGISKMTFEATICSWLAVNQDIKNFSMSLFIASQEHILAYRLS